MNQAVFVKQTKCVYCEVGNRILYKICEHFKLTQSLTAAATELSVSPFWLWKPTSQASTHCRQRQHYRSCCIVVCLVVFMNSRRKMLLVISTRATGNRLKGFS